MDERRLLLALALSLLVMTAYTYLFPPPKRVASMGPSPQAPSASTTPSVPSPSPASVVLPPSPAPVAPARSVVDEQERRVELTSRDLTIAFTNRGARLLSWQLNRFADDRGRPEEMVQVTVGAGPRPLDVETGDPAVDTRLREALFKPSSETLSLLEPSRSGHVTFEFSDGDLRVEKEIGLSGQGYLVSVRVAVQRAGQPLPARILWGPGLGNPTRAERDVQGYLAPEGVALTTGVDRFPVAKLAPNGQSLGVVRWAGVESHYFVALFVPPGEHGAVEIRPLTLPPHEDGKPNLAPVVGVDLGAGKEAALLYVGPKDYQEMARAGHDLARVVPVGEWIGPIVVPLMGLLGWVHGHVGNYGWSIVVLTVLINLAMAPFRHYSIANGLKMAKISPEMKVIQERYRKVPLMDPKRQEMQEEMGALYSRHGMNMGTQMMVGCLPILLTMPFLIAFYRVLTVSIELRGAPFLWIADLSQKDPLFITPVLMGASMFAMQKMTPSAMDPSQQRVMMIMPIMLMVMFFAAPAGLNLYWLASNLCSIVQQTITQRILRGSEGAAAAARKRK